MRKKERLQKYFHPNLFLNQTLGGMRNIFAFNQFYLIDCEVYKKIDFYICDTFFL